MNNKLLTKKLQIINWRRARYECLLHVGLIFFGVITFFPFVFLIISSLKNNAQFYNYFWIPVHPFRFVNYLIAADRLWRYILNSAFYSSTSIIGICALASITGFVFARYGFPGKTILFYAIISLIMIPGILTLAPRFILVKNLGLLNTPTVLILPWMAGGQIIGIWLMRTYFESLPIELFDAARIDGASGLQIFFRIALPLSTPMLGTVTIMTLLSTWNDYIWPLVTVGKDSLKPLTVGLLTFQGEYLTSWGPLFAGYVIAAIPLILVFMFTVKYFIAGLTSGAIKI